MVCRDTPTHGWVCGWMGVSVGQWVGLGHITKYQINLDLIEIIQFCLIYDLLDILDIFLDILLKPPQLLMGLFFVIFFPHACLHFKSDIRKDNKRSHVKLHNILFFKKEKLK